MLQFTGNAPVEVTKFEKEAMRCNRCGHEFMSDQKINKWTHSARSSIVMQKNFGMPFYRLAKLQSFYGVPIAKSTLWEQCSGVWGEAGQHVYNHLLQLAAQSEKLNADDTGVTILEVQKNNKSRAAKDKKGCHTTVILASHKDKKIALYISADRHCGHNLKNLLLMKGDRNDKVKLMTDALSCNTAFIPETGVDVVESKCLTHGRRKFCELEKLP